jgi:putative DNA primase/helicase
LKVSLARRPDSIQSLREFVGYVLSGRTDMHKILLFIGPPRSGRGTIARVLAALLGHANVASPALASLCTQFGLAPLIGKPLAIIGDARLGRADHSQVVERLLSISGEDMLTIDRKYREAWTGKLSTRFLIISNELPGFADASGAIASRFIILTLQESFLGREDHALTERLLKELSGILRWALEGLAELARERPVHRPTILRRCLSNAARPRLTSTGVYPRPVHAGRGNHC